MLKDTSFQTLSYCTHGIFNISYLRTVHNKPDGEMPASLADSNLLKTGTETTTFSKRNLRELCWVVGHVNRLSREVTIAPSLPECLNNILGHMV